MKQSSCHIESSHVDLLKVEEELPITRPFDYEKSRTIHQNPNYLLAPLRSAKKSLQQQVQLHRNFPRGSKRINIENMSNNKSHINLSNIEQTKNIDRKLLNLLYLQQMKDVNPYIQTLHEIYNNPKQYSMQQIKRVKELCYIGLGKNLVTQKKVSVPPYSRVNLLIREFMIDVITQQIKQLQRKYPNRIYIQCNDRALGYNTKSFNERMSQYIDKKQLQQIITQTNKIIQKQFINFKQKKEIQISFEVKASFWVSILGIFLLVIYVQIYKNKMIMILAWVLICLSVLLNIVSLLVRQRGFQQNQNIIDQIQKKLVVYLERRNQQNKKCKWKCGKDFYWLQLSPN